MVAAEAGLNAAASARALNHFRLTIESSRIGDLLLRSCNSPPLLSWAPEYLTLDCRKRERGQPLRHERRIHVRVRPGRRVVAPGSITEPPIWPATASRVRLAHS